MTERIEEAAVGAPDGAPELEAVMHLIFDRIETLDAEKRSLQRTMAIGFATFLALGLLGLIFVGRLGNGGSPHDALLTDAAGRVRARLAVDHENATTLQLLDESGNAQAVLAASGAGPGLTFYDRSGNARMQLGIVSESPVLEVMDAKSGRASRIDLAPPVPVSASESVRPPASPRTVTARYQNSLPRLVSTRARACPAGTLGCIGG